MVTRRGGNRRGRPDPRQMPIDWAAPAMPAEAGAPAAMPTVAGPGAMPTVATADPKAAGGAVGTTTLVERLPWDFAATFPSPLPEAVDAGTVDEADVAGENLAALHEAYAGQMTAALGQLDAVADAARRKVEPATGRRPRSHAARERLDRYLAAEPGRLRRWFDILVETYGAAFGTEAADAFARAVRARHAGAEVVADGPRGQRPATEPMPPLPHPRMTVADVVRGSAVSALVGSGEVPGGLARRKLLERRPRPPGESVGRLRVPKPLAEAVAAGRFGRDEHGRVVCPDADEVWAITRPTVEAVVGRVAGLAGAERRGLAAAEVAERQAQVRAGLQDYADDFGQAAAERLLAYAHAQVTQDEPDAAVPRGR